MARDEALFYHRHGFPALALALFRTRQTQKDLSCVPVEYVENSIYMDHPTEAGAQYLRDDTAVMVNAVIGGKEPDTVTEYYRFYCILGVFCSIFKTLSPVYSGRRLLSMWATETIEKSRSQRYSIVGQRNLTIFNVLFTEQDSIDFGPALFFQFSFKWRKRNVLGWE